MIQDKEQSKKDLIEDTAYAAYTLNRYATALQCMLAMGVDGEQQLDIKQSELLSLFIFIDEASKGIHKNLNQLLDLHMGEKLQEGIE